MTQFVLNFRFTPRTIQHVEARRRRNIQQEVEQEEHHRTQLETQLAVLNEKILRDSEIGGKRNPIDLRSEQDDDDDDDENVPVWNLAPGHFATAHPPSDSEEEDDEDSTFHVPTRRRFRFGSTNCHGALIPNQ